MHALVRARVRIRHGIFFSGGGGAYAGSSGLLKTAAVAAVVEVAHFGWAGADLPATAAGAAGVGLFA